MKRWLLLLWLLLPLPAVVWHYGPGQRWLARDRALALIHQAQQAEKKNDFAAAETLFRDAGTTLGPQDVEIRMQTEISAV